MATLPEVRESLAAIEAQLRTMHTEAGERAFTPEENTQFDALDKDRADHVEAIERMESEAARDERVAERRARWGSVQVSPQRVDPFDMSTMRGASEDDLISRAVAATADVRYRGLHVSDEARQAATRMIERVPGAAQHVLATGSPDYMSAFRSWLASGGQPIYTQAEAEAVRAALTLTSANGGYTLPYLLDPTLIPTGAATRNPIRRIARIETGTANVWNGVTVANVTTAWKSEGSAFTEGGPTMGGVTVTAAALTAYVAASYEIFQDSNLQSQLPGLIAESIDFAESAAFISGSGSGAPKGVITAVSGTAGSLVTATTRGTFNSTSAVDTLAMVNAVATRYEDSAVWVMNKATHNAIKQQVVGTAGVPIVDMTMSNQVLGSEVYRSSTITATTTSGNILAVLGDFSQYIVYDRLGVSLEFIPNVVDGSGIPTGQRGLVAFKRVGGDVSDVNAFRLLKA